MTLSLTRLGLTRQIRVRRAGDVTPENTDTYWQQLILRSAIARKSSPENLRSTHVRMQHPMWSAVGLEPVDALQIPHAYFRRLPRVPRDAYLRYSFVSNVDRHRIRSLRHGRAVPWQYTTLRAGAAIL
jgi:hypothetical protein